MFPSIKTNTKQNTTNTTDERVKKIVDDIYENRIGLPTYKSTTYIEQEIQEEFVDHLREAKSICTDFVVNDFFKSPELLFNFLKLICNTFNEAIDYYILRNQLTPKNKIKNINGSIFFVYKGGTVLRYIKNEFNYELTGNIRNILDEMKDFFKRSDADFSIYINHIDPLVADRYEQIYNHMTILSYYLQNLIRENFLLNLSDHFDYFRYNKEYKIGVLNTYLNNLNKMASLSDPNNIILNGCKFTKLIFDDLQVGVNDNNNNNIQNININNDFDNINTFGNTGSFKNDMRIQKINTNKNAILSVNDVPNIIYISSNESLEFDAGYDEHKMKIKFNLVRSKVVFIANYIDKSNNTKKIKLSGELIDVSIPHRSSTELDHFFKEERALIKNYKMKHADDIVEFKGYSLKYLIEDLENILFKGVDRPWSDNKYDKRINRLFYMYLIDIFIKITNHAERKKYVENYLKSIILPFKSLINIHINELTIFLEKIEQQLYDYKENNKYATHLNDFIDELYRISKFASEDNEQYLKFMTLIENKLQWQDKIVDQSLKNLNNPDVNLQELYEGDIKHMAGGYYTHNDNIYKNKYLKYKNKYLNLKK
jgi:hypothetical protein